MVELVKQDYTKNKQMYTTVKSVLESKLSSSVVISHVGSTAIPSIIYGKNIIDVLVGVVDSTEFLNAYNIISSLGYIPSANSKTDIYQFFASKNHETSNGDTHIHLVIMNTDRYNDFITLRDYLLTFPNEAIAYSDHKVELVSSGITERKVYRATKSLFVESLIDKARKWKSRQI